MLFVNGNLKDVKLIKNKLNDSLYPYSLTVTYETKDEFGNTHELVIKNVDLPICCKSQHISFRESLGHRWAPERFIDIGYGETQFSKNTTIEDKIIKYAVKEMTIEEIEKKLGHKVKVISKEAEE